MTELAPVAFQGAVAYIHSAAKKVLLGIHILLRREDKNHALFYTPSANWS